MKLGGTWNLQKDKNDNYDKFLEAVGMNKLKRGMVTKLGGSLCITFTGDKMYVKTVNGPKTKEREMTVGSSFEDEGPNGGPFKGTWNYEGESKMVGKFQSKKDKEKSLTITRERIGDELIQTMDFGGVVCKRYYKHAK